MLDKALSDEACRSRKLPAIRPWSRGIEKKRWNTLRMAWLGDYMADRYHKKSYVLGCNMSFFRSDFFAVNGYDEFFEGWGCEDSDFFRRLLLNGVRNRRLKFVGLTYHLWHKVASQHNIERNTEYSLRKDPKIWCDNGAVKPNGNS